MIPVISDPESLSTPGSASAAENADETGSFGVLDAPQRLAVLRYLVDRDEPSVPVGDLADHVTMELEGDERTGGRIAEWGDALLGTRRRVAISLRHVHVPKLADAGVVDFDLDANTVALREEGAALLAGAETSDEGDGVRGVGDAASTLPEAAVQ